MEQNLKVLAIFQTDAVPPNLAEVFSRRSITLHHARSGAAALILTGNSLYDLLVVEQPLADLSVDGVLSAIQSFEWASAGAPALVMAEAAEVEATRKRLDSHPVRVLSKAAGNTAIRQAVAELLGVPVRSSSRMMVNVEVKTEANASLRCFQSENVSESGMLLRGAQAIPIGMAVNLEFCLPDESEPVRGTAMVVRHAGGGETPGVGLRFVELGRTEILRLRRYVDRTVSRTPPMASESETAQPAGA